MKHLKTILLSAIIVLVTAFSILLDIFSVSYGTNAFRDAAYWANVLSVQTAVIAIIFAARSLAKDRECYTYKEYLDLREGLSEAYRDLAKNNLNTPFRAYIEADNLRRKTKLYTDRLRRGIRRQETKIERAEGRVRRRFARGGVAAVIAVTAADADSEQKVSAAEEARKREIEEAAGRAAPRARARLAELRAALDRAPEDVRFLRVRYPKVTYGVIFGGMKEKESGEADLFTHEGRAIASMMFSKIVMIFAFGVLVTSFVGFDVLVSVRQAVFKAITKVLQIAMGIYTGYSSGQGFVRGDLCSKLRKRLDYVRIFKESGSGR